MIISKRRGYKDKYFIYYQIYEPFVMLFESIFNILLLPTPYQCVIYSNYLKHSVKNK